MFNIALDPASPVIFAGAILVPPTPSIQGLRMITAAPGSDWQRAHLSSRACLSGVYLVHVTE